MNTAKTISALMILLTPVYATALCGDALLDHNERCDDGNALDGDGCSSLCQVEAGFDCSAPVEAGEINAILAGGFQATLHLDVIRSWTTSPDTPLCNIGQCGIGGGSGPAEGDGWAWFGGRALASSQYAEQQVVIPAVAMNLSFKIENLHCDSASDVVRVLIDGTQIWATDGADGSCGAIGYRDVSIDLSTAAGGPYNDDAQHTVRIESDTLALSGGATNFFIDDVTIDIGDTVPTPSVCSQQRDVCQIERLDALAGDFTPINWTVFNTGAVAVDWGSSDDGVCNSVNGPPGNLTGGTGDAACIDADATATLATNGQIDSFLCTDAIDFTLLQDAALQFRLNYQLVSDAASDDGFEVLAADTAVPPSAATIATFARIYDSNSANVGELGLSPGEHLTLDLSALDGSPSAYVCFRYRSRDDWYAQLDDVAIVATSCTGPLDSDGDGVTDDLDNCTLIANPGQQDSNGDGHGNACDADLNDDCIINVVDLGIFRTVFFSANPHADFNSDGVVNATDLGILRLLFFGPPGPSAAGACP